MTTLLAIAIPLYFATNLDDFALLVGFFGGSYHKSSIIIGQFLGIFFLTAVSIAAAIASMNWIHDKAIIGLFGIAPIVVGLKALWKKEDKKEDGDISYKNKNWFSQTRTVAVTTIANGGDNLGIYTPSFTFLNALDLVITTGVFMIMTGIWCLAAYLTSKGIRHVGERYFDITKWISRFLPIVFVSIGGYVLWKNESIPMLYKQIPTWWSYVSWSP